MADVTELSLGEGRARLERVQRGQSLREQALEWSGSLRLFLEHAWGPGLGIKGRFVGGWHIDAVCEHLEAVSSGEIRRLIISVPPGTTKSSCASVCWPVWDWTREPGRRWLTCSYARELATKFSLASRDLILSEWFQSRWGDKVRLKGDENLKSAYANTAGGDRRSAPVGQSTGFHADIIVIDDPHNATDVLSDAKREEALEWHDGTITMRLVDHMVGAEVIIAQRLHEKDLIGHVLAKDPGEWTVLCMPERYEGRHPWVTPGHVELQSGRVIAGDCREREGELLCELRIDAATNARRIRDLGAFRAAGQLQQRPAAREGAILKRTGWQFFPPRWLEDEERHLLPRFHALVQSWDTAFRDRSVNDYVVGQLWGLTGPHCYLLAVRKDRMGLSATKQAMRDLSAFADLHWPKTPLHILVENASNGPEIIAEMRTELRGVQPVQSSAMGDKTARAEAAEPALEGKNIYLPGGSDSSLPSFYDPAVTPAFAQELVESTASFPFGEHDDDVDAFTQMVIWSRGKGRRMKARLVRPSSRSAVYEDGGGRMVA